MKYYKYNNKKAEKYGHKFDSQMELDFYEGVCLPKLISGEFKAVELQQTFILQDGFTRPQDGKKILPIKYVADFVITLNDDRIVVVDVKGQVLSDFKLKWKMLMNKYKDNERYIFKCVRGSGKNIKKGINHCTKWTDVY